MKNTMVIAGKAHLKQLLFLGLNVGCKTNLRAAAPKIPIDLSTLSNNTILEQSIYCKNSGPTGIQMRAVQDTTKSNHQEERGEGGSRRGREKNLGTPQVAG